MAERTKATTSATEREIPSSSSDSASEKGGFFPWLEDEEQPNFTTKIIKRFPILGAVGLIGSALTVVLSWLTLFFFNGHKVIDSGRLPKPAAWLSVILSLNSILAHMAISQGIAVSWWYRASRKQATVEELHNVWATGSSVFSAITSWKAFNYIALATVFVATLPVNGILLQNAVTSGVNYKNITAPSTNFTIASKLPAGFSAELNPDGSVATYSTAWQVEIPFVVADTQGVFKSYNTNNTCKGDCAATLEGVGFESTCTQSTIPYNLPLDGTSNETVDSTMFFSQVTWNSSAPYTIGLNTLHKPNGECSGEYIVQNCTLQMAKAKYPVEVQFNATGDNQWYWYLTSQINGAHRSSVYYPSEVVERYPVIPETNSTIFGGIAEALASYFDSSIILHRSGNGSSLKIDGLYAQQIQPSSSGGYDESGNLIVVPNKCNTTYSYFGTFGDPSSFLMDSIRSTFFYTSIYAADQDQVSYQPVARTPDLVGINEYHVLWRYWAGSLAVTLSVVLFILPTYYGFWTLARKTTLSPFETARAFHAPVLKEAPRHLDTPALLKEVGGKNLHTDLEVRVVEEEKSG